MNSTIPSLHSFDGHYSRMRQTPPRRERYQRAMCRRVLCSDQQKGAERNEEAKKHRLGFIVYFQKLLGVPKIGIERIDQGDEQKPQHNQEDLQRAFAQRVDLFVERNPRKELRCVSMA